MREFKGRIAFAGVMLDGRAANGDMFGLGIAEQGEQGYRPYVGPTYPTHEAASRAAEALNAELGYSLKEAATIIASTMFGRQPRRKRA